MRAKEEVEMTLGEAVREAQQWLQEEMGTPGAGSPFGWQSLVVQATDVLCQETGCLLVTVEAVGREAVVVPEGTQVLRRLVRVGDPERVVGLRIPGRAWETDARTGEALPLGDESVCPLPGWACSAVPVKAALLRCLQFPTPENGARIPGLQREYALRSGEVAARASRELRRALRS